MRQSIPNIRHPVFVHVITEKSLHITKPYPRGEGTLKNLMHHQYGSLSVSMGFILYFPFAPEFSKSAAGRQNDPLSRGIPERCWHNLSPVVIFLTLIELSQHGPESPLLVFRITSVDNPPCLRHPPCYDKSQGESGGKATFKKKICISHSSDVGMW